MSLYTNLHFAERYLRNSWNNAIILGGKQRQTIHVQDGGSQSEG